MSTVPSTGRGVNTGWQAVQNGKSEIEVLFDEKSPAGMPVLVHIAGDRVSIREAQDAAMKLGEARTSAIVGVGGLSGASAGALRRLVREAGMQEATHYWVSPVDGAVGGIGVEFRKLGEYDDDARHHVLVEPDGYAECDCRGFVAHNHCRHAIAATLLVAAGLMRPSPRPEQAVEIPAKAARYVSPVCVLCGSEYANCKCEV
jgi:hypothetical protein